MPLKLYALSFKTSHRLLYRSISLLLTLYLLAGALAAQSTVDAPQLELGKPIEKQISGDEVHAYGLTLAAGQFIHIIVQQRGIDVVVRLLGPDGKQLIEVDSPNGPQGAEPLLWVAESSGPYRLEIRSLDKNALAGRYQASVKELRPATSRDADSIATQALFLEAVRLTAAPSREALEQALQKFLQALPYFHSANDSERESLTLLTVGSIYIALGEKQKALDNLMLALPLLRAIANRAGEADALNFIGRIYADSGEPRKAQEYYQQALPLFRALGDQKNEANVLNSIGGTYYVLGEKRKSLDYSTQALRLYRSLNDQTSEANTLGYIGLIYFDLGEKRQALDYYLQALPLMRKTGNRPGEVFVLTGAGRTSAELGEKQEALNYYQQALSIAHEIRDRKNEALTLSSIGNINAELGEKQKALDYQQQALAIYREVQDRGNEGIALNLIGMIYAGLGESRKALDYHTQALQAFRDLRDQVNEAITLIYAGKASALAYEYQNALDYFTQALQLSRANNNRESEATALFSIGNTYYSLGKPQQALDYLSQALSICRTIRNNQCLADTLLGIGINHLASGELLKVSDYLTEALSLYRAAGNKFGEAETLSATGGMYEGLGNLEKALDYVTQGLSIYRAIGNKFGEAKALNATGSIYRDLGKYPKALEYYLQALTLTRNGGDRANESVALSSLGNIYNLLGETQKALDYLTQALPLCRAVGNKGCEAETLVGIGMNYFNSGESPKAIDYLSQDLSLCRATNNKVGEANVLVYISAVYGSLGESQKAIDYLSQALSICRTTGNKTCEAKALNATGSMYEGLGEPKKALEYYQQALTLTRNVDPVGESVALSSLGNIYNLLGETQKALDYLTQALLFYRATSNKGGEAAVLNSVSSIYFFSREQQKAIDYLTQALSLYRAIGSKGGQAFTLSNIGMAFSYLGEQQKALDYQQQALTLARAIGDKRGEASILVFIATLEFTQGNLTDSKVHIEGAVSIFESLRTKIDNRDLRTSFFATVQDYYEFYIYLLMNLRRQNPNAGYDGEALQIAERARARNLLDTLAEANADIRQGVDPKLVERERTLRIQLNAKAQAERKLLLGAHTDEQAKAIAAEIEALTGELQQVETQIRQSSPRYAALTQPRPLTLKEIQAEVLDRDTVLLEYSLGTMSSYLWAVTQDSITSYELPSRFEIEEYARRVYDILNARNRTVDGETEQQRRARIEQADAKYAQAAADLSGRILAPVAKQLGNKRLLIIADGVLQYIPFAALPDPSGDNAPLVVKHEIVNLPSASTLAILRREIKDRKPPDKAVAVLADPVFDDADERIKRNSGKGAREASRQKRGDGERGELPLDLERSAEESGLIRLGLGFSRLPGTRREAEQILTLVPATESKRAFDFDASRSTALSVELSRYRYIHFATHGILNSVNPQLSGIVLSLVDEQGRPQDGFLRTNDIFNLKLPVELVVLSACQTGLGKEIKGEGVVGLTRGFMYAGTPRVVVSLWSVSDAGTAELMTRFYSAMLKDRMRPAEALRAAQVSLLKEKRWEQPFYWAAFTLQGEWR